MYIEIISLSKKGDSNVIVNRSDDLRERLDKYGYSLVGVKKAVHTPNGIKSALNSIAKSNNKPDVVIVADSLKTKDSKSFRKYFVESVVEAEKCESEPAPKKYWKKRNQAFKEAKKNHASQEELDELTNSFRVFKKKSKVFTLGDFGNGYKGYCFMFKGIKVAAIPKVELTDESLNDVISLAAVRTEEVFENSANDYPNGFSTIEYVPEKTGFVNRYIPVRGDSAKEISRKCVVIASFMVFLAALSLLYYNMVFLSMKNAELNGEIQRIAHGVEDETDGKDKKPEKGDTINWKALKKINNEIIGWVKVDHTQIDYPVLWHKGDDRISQYYLNHNYKGGYDSFGSIFLDYRCTKGNKSKNIVLHGHHMNDGSMFGNMLKYGSTSGNLDFYKKSPTIDYDVPSAEGTYKIISVFKTNTLSNHGEFFNYMVGNFQNEKDFMNYVYNVRVRSMINCPVDVNEDDKLITLSTCSYEFTNFRTVIVARRVRKGESTKVDVSRASLNKKAVWPDVYYSAYGGSRPKVTDFCTAYEAGQIDWYSGTYDFASQKVVEPVTTEPTTSAKETQPTQKPTEAKVYLTVKFINYDGSLISKQKVEYGKAAKPPANPVKPSDQYYDYTFKGWQLDFKKVTANMTIAPNFEAKLKPEYATQG